MVKEQLLKRAKSLAWQAGCVGALAIVAFLGTLLANIEITEDWQRALVVVTGLVLAQFTKWLSNNKRRFGRALKFKQ